jgi:hypothetical protein
VLEASGANVPQRPGRPTEEREGVNEHRDGGTP